MDSLSGELKILPARPVDYDDLLLLCRKSGVYFDYIGQSLKKWLNPADKSGDRVTEIAYLNNKMAGFYSCAIFKNYAFGEILRVDKDVQREGLGSLLVNRALEIAKGFHLNNLRTAILTSNRQAANLFTKLDFYGIGGWETRIFRSDRLLGKNNNKRDENIYIAQRDDLSAILIFIKENPTLFSTKMYAQNFSWRPLDEENFLKEISASRVFVRRDNNKIRSLFLYAEIDSILEINCFGDCCADFLSFLFVKRFSHLRQIRIYTPFAIELPFNTFQLSFKVLEKSF